VKIERGHAAVNGTRLYYEVAGEGEPVVLLHGFTLDARMWDAQFGPFAERYRVLRYDLRGFGRSDLPDGAEYARTDDLRALLAHLGIARAHVIGLSMGGAAAIDFALAHPAMTRTLTTVDAALSGYRMSVEWEALRGHVVAADNVAEIKARWLALPLFAPANEQPAVAARLAAMVADYSGIHWVRSDHHRRAAALDELERLRVPVLAVLGERDLPDFHVIADLLATRAGARKVVIPGSGHMSPMEAPAAFNRVVLDFLAAHSF
jgi:3-oxoadipate enol-lactonase